MIVFGALRPLGRSVAEVDHPKIERIRTEEPIMKLSPEVEQALKTYERIGWGGEIPTDDLEAVHDFVIATLHRTAGIDLQTVIKMVHMLEGGNWSKGWTVGYGSAKNHYTPSFSLDGGS